MENESFIMYECIVPCKTVHGLLVLPLPERETWNRNETNSSRWLGRSHIGNCSESLCSAHLAPGVLQGSKMTALRQRSCYVVCCTEGHPSPMYPLRYQLNLINWNMLRLMVFHTEKHDALVPLLILLQMSKQHKAHVRQPQKLACIIILQLYSVRISPPHQQLIFYKSLPTVTAQGHILCSSAWWMKG